MPLPLYPALVSYVVRNMRACDAAEVWPVTPPGLDPDTLGRALCEASKAGAVFLHDDIPAAAIGAAPQHPGVWGGWMIATDAFPRVWRDLYRYARAGGPMEAEVVGQGGHRLHVNSIVGHPDAGKLLRALGFDCEAPRMRGMGRGCEDYSLWARFVEPA